MTNNSTPDRDGRFKVFAELSDWIVDIASKDQQFYIKKYGEQLKGNNVIWLHDWNVFHNCFEFAKLLDTLILLYDKVFWYMPCSTLVIRKAWKNQLDVQYSLRKAGLDESFPERLIEFVRRGVVVPIGSNWGPPLEDQFEVDIAKHMIPCGGSYSAILSQKKGRILSKFVEIALKYKLTSSESWRRAYASYGDNLGCYILDLVLMPKIFGVKSIFATPRGIKDSLCIASDALMTDYQPVHKIDGGANTQFVEQTSCFFESILLASPCRLTIDEIWSFRKAKVAVELRSWLADTYDRAEQRLVNAPPSTALISEFNELASTYITPSDTWIQEVAISGTSAALGALIGGVPGATIGGAGSVAAQRGLKYLMKRRRQQSNNVKWILALHDLKDRVRKRE